LRYSNKGSTTCQHVPKGNIVSFAQDPESAIKLLNPLPLSLESLINTIGKHFVGSSHQFIEYQLKVAKYYTYITTWLKMNHIICTKIQL
jgi:hypothetical protein